MKNYQNRLLPRTLPNPMTCCHVSAFSRAQTECHSLHIGNEHQLGNLPAEIFGFHSNQPRRGDNANYIFVGTFHQALRNYFLTLVDSMASVVSYGTSEIAREDATLCPGQNTT